MPEVRKTPEEIMIGLECCEKYLNGAPEEECCHVCNYQYNCAELKLDALDYIQQLEAQVPKWISVEDRLPENGQQVLIYDGGATQWNASVHSAVFVKGRTQDEIITEYRDTGRLWHTFGDEEGNNRKPYAWRGDAHMRWFGQQVTHWMPLPEPPPPKEEEK